MAVTNFDKNIKDWMEIFGLDRETAEEFAREECKHESSIEDLLNFFDKSNDPDIVIGCW